MWSYPILGKTLVHDRVFSLNSTLFRAGCTRVFTVPFFRSKAFFCNPDSVSSAVGQYASCVVGCPGSSARSAVLVSFLRRHRKVFYSSQRSLTRDLGMRVSSRVLRESGFFAREQFYLDLPEPPPLPTFQGLTLPAGFVQRELPRRPGPKRRAREEESLFFRSLLELCWLPQKARGPVDPWIGVRDGTFRYVRLRPLPFASVWLLCLRSQRINKEWKMGARREKIWQCIPDRPGSIAWVKGGCVGG